MNSRSLFPLLI